MPKTSKELMNQLEAKADPLFLIKKSTLKRLLPNHLTEEARLTLGVDTGVDYVVVDPAHVATRRISVKPSTEFKVFRDADVCVDLGIICTWFNQLQDNDWMLFGSGKGDPHVLWAAYDDVVRWFKMPEVVDSRHKAPNLEFMGVVSVLARDLRRAMLELEATGSHFTLNLSSKDGFWLEGAGTKGIEGTEVYPPHRVIYHKEEVYDIRTILSVDYTHNYLRTLHDHEEVGVHLSTDYPVAFETRPGGLDMFLQAPRIDRIR